jgi:FG-GAP repeat protein
MTCKGLCMRKLFRVRRVVLTSLLTVSFCHLAAPADWSSLRQQAYLKPSVSSQYNQFGFSVSISGDTVVIGANLESSSATGVNGNQNDSSAPRSGTAYVFVRDLAGRWTQQAYLKASNTDARDEFGYSVAVSGDSLVVGAPFEDSRATGVNGDHSDNSLTNSGAAYVFVRTGTEWTQQAYLKAATTDSIDQFGVSVAISGNTIIVGANREDSSARGVNNDAHDNGAEESGAAYVFVRTGTNWTQQAYLKASNTDAQDQFGWPVAISGDTALVAAALEDSRATGVNGNETDNGATDSGAAYVFVRTGTSWTQQAYLKASNTEGNDQFGKDLAISGDTVVVGAWLENSAARGVDGDQTDNTVLDSGAAYVFVRTGAEWTQQAYLKASNTGSQNDRFGRSVAISGDTVVVGATREDSAATGINGDQFSEAANEAGAAYLFSRNGAIWTQQAYLKASNTGAGDTFGVSIAVSGHTAVVGAVFEDSGATGVNGDGTDNTAIDSGAAYIFAAFTGPWLTLVPDDSGGYFIRFHALADVQYQLQRTTSLDGTWTTIDELSRFQEEMAEFHDQSPPDNQAFYRVVLYGVVIP